MARRTLKSHKGREYLISGVAKMLVKLAALTIRVLLHLLQQSVRGTTQTRQSDE